MRENRRVFRNGSLLIAASLFAVIGSIAWWQVRPLSFRSVPVENTLDASRINAPPARSVRAGTHGLAPLADQLPKFEPSATTLARTKGIRTWVRNQQGDARELWMGANDSSSDDAVTLLERIRAGVPGSCRRMAYLLLGALQAGGIDARIVVLGASLDMGSAYHSTVEAWLPEERRWILVDPSYDTFFSSAGRPISAAEAVAIWRQGGTVDFDHEGRRKPYPRNASFAHFRHVYAATASPAVDGVGVEAWTLRRTPFLHYHPGAPAYPETVKRLSVAAIALSAGAILIIALVLICRFLAWALSRPPSTLPASRHWRDQPSVARVTNQRPRVVHVDDIA